jgi:hypothetical protein
MTTWGRVGAALAGLTLVGCQAPAAPVAPGPGETTGPLAFTELRAAGPRKVGEAIDVVAVAQLASGCDRVGEVTASADPGAMTVAIAGTRVTTPGAPCADEVATKEVTTRFTPTIDGTWVISAPRFGPEPLRATVEVRPEGWTPGAHEGWTSAPLPFAAVTWPAAAKAGEPVTVPFKAEIGSSSCAAFEYAGAEVDEEARRVTLRATKTVAPAGTTCDADLRIYEGSLGFTMKGAGAWTLVADGPAGTRLTTTLGVAP